MGEQFKEMSRELLEEIAGSFVLEGELSEIKPYGGGHINDTFLLVTKKPGRTTNKRYILQRISEELTKDAAALMKNIQAITSHLRKKVQEERGVLTLVPTKEGEVYLAHQSGNWRVYDFVEDSLCLTPPQEDSFFYKSAVAFGNFIGLLSDFPAETLFEPIPNFHNTPERFRQLHAAIEEDRAGRVGEAEKEIDFLLQREREAGGIYEMLWAGDLPLRVTHNDTKLDNILFDQQSLEPLCIIDLDTVMPGTALYDFGDGIRSGAATAAEDEKDLAKVGLDIHRFQIYRQGFISACPSLTPLEIQLLPQGAKSITLEQGARFLADYLNGDIYYHTAYPEHNLVRTRTQLKLVSEMEEHWEELWE